MSRNYLQPVEEENWAHCQMRAHTLGLFILLFVFPFILIAIVTAPKSYELPEDNNYNATWEFYLDISFASSRNWIITSKGQNVTFDREGLLKDRILKRHGMKRIDFGTTWATYCWDDPLPPSYLYFPSLLRIFEFRPLTQAFLRLAVFSTLIWRMLLIFFRFRFLKTVYCSIPKCVEYLTLITPWIASFDSFFALRILLQHQDADKSFKETFPYSVIFFGVFTSLHMLTHTVLDWSSKSEGSRSVLRIFCLAIFVFAFPYTVQLQCHFLHRKTCNPFVPFLVAIPDYAIALSLIIYYVSLIWELPNVQLILCPLPQEFDFPRRNDYKAAIVELRDLQLLF